MRSILICLPTLADDRGWITLQRLFSCLSPIMILLSIGALLEVVRRERQDYLRHSLTDSNRLSVFRYNKFTLG